MKNLKDSKPRSYPQLRGEVRNCHLAPHLILLLLWVNLRHLLLLLNLICRMFLMMPLLLCMIVGGNCPPRAPMGPEPLVCVVRGRREHREQIEADARAVLPRFGPRRTRKTLLLLSC